jgi:ATP-dependent Zn protease
MLDRLYRRTRDILQTHRPALDALSAALLESETLDGHDALRILAAAGVPLPTPGT